METLVAILVSRSTIDHLDRCIESVKHSDVVVICNDKDDSVWARCLSSSLSTNLVRTESNGTPGRGKNSCLEYFLETSYNSLIQVDADDLLLPGAVRNLTNIAEKNDADVISLLDSQCYDGETIVSAEEYFKSKQFRKRIPRENRGQVADHFGSLERCGRDASFWYLGRPVLYSRRGAEIRFQENLLEDVSKFQLDLMRSDLNLVFYRNNDIYLYDTTSGNTLQNFLNNISETEIVNFWHNVLPEDIEEIKEKKPLIISENQVYSKEEKINYIRSITKKVNKL